MHCRSTASQVVPFALAQASELSHETGTQVGPFSAFTISSPFSQLCRAPRMLLGAPLTHDPAASSIAAATAHHDGRERVNIILGQLVPLYRGMLQLATADEDQTNKQTIL
jgi:hypothetical protein